MKITIEEESAHTASKTALITSFYPPFARSTSIIPDKMIDIYVSALFPGMDYDIRKEVSRIRAFVERYDSVSKSNPTTMPVLTDTIAVWMRRGTLRSMDSASSTVAQYLGRLHAIANSLPQSGLFTCSEFIEAAASNAQLLLMSIKEYEYPQVSFLTSIKSMFGHGPLRAVLGERDPGIPNLIDEANKLIDQELQTHNLMGQLVNSRVTGESRDI